MLAKGCIFCCLVNLFHVIPFVPNYLLSYGSSPLLSFQRYLIYSPYHLFLSAALRFTRKIIGMKDELYNRYIIKGKLLEPIVKAFSENGQRYNLLNSAVIEMFEFIRLVRLVFSILEFLRWRFMVISKKSICMNAKRAGNQNYKSISLLIEY